MREHILLLNDAYFSREMVYCLVIHDVFLRCVSTKTGNKLEVVLDGDFDNIERYMNRIGAVRNGYSRWEKVSLL